jgi:hypothetical protein
MLTITIERYKPKAVAKPKVKPGSEAHKYFIYWKLVENMANCELFDHGNEYFVKNHKGKGVIINWADFKEAEWDGLKCKPLELFMFEDNTCVMAHPGDLLDRA